ncbi:MAG TPA: response regulator [Bacteroidia bacterium]|jgi:signal transduction histidine kinase
MLIRILFLEDSSSDVDLMKYELKKAGIEYVSEWVETEKDFLAALKNFHPDIILSDYSLPSFDGLKAFKLFREQRMMIPFILVTSNMSEQLALDCLNEGVDDFVLKSSFRRIPKAIKRAIEKKNIEKEKETISVELINSQIQLRELVNEIQVVREKERAHIAREIHDELGQQLTALKMDIGSIMHKHGKSDLSTNKKLNEMLLLCDGVIDTVRRISSELRPAIIDDLGLVAALEWKCNDFEDKTKIDCRFISSVAERKFENVFSINIYRVLQEALTNITRHAKAKSVIVTVSESDKELFLEIVDDGQGMEAREPGTRRTLGILGMKERAGLLGGVLNIVSIKDKGTHIILTLPFKNGYSNS